MDLTQYLPSLDGLQSSLASWMKVLVIAGPIIMLLLGLYYFFLSPKEANYSAGYRFRYAMSRVGVWRFTQKIAGIAYGGLGLVLSIVMLCIMAGFNDMNAPDLVWCTAKCLLWQIILALIAMLVVDAIVVIRYNYNGKLRSRKKKDKAAPVEGKPAAPAKKPGPAAAPARKPGPAAAPASRPVSKATPARSASANGFRRPDDLAGPAPGAPRPSAKAPVKKPAAKPKHPVR